MQRRLVAVLLLATFVAAAVAQQPQNPDGEPTVLSGSECYQCHTVQVVTEPRLERILEVRPPTNVTFVVGEPVDYHVAIRNGWTALVYNITATLDLSQAPSLGFSPGKEPVHESVAATLPVGESSERTARTILEVPSGSTDVLIRLVPGTREGLLAPDLDLRLWPPDADPDADAPIEVAAAGSGEAEVFHVQGGQEVADIGVGNWTLEAVQSVPGDVPASLIEQDLTFTLDTWFNVTGEPFQVRSSGARLDGQAPGTPQQTTMTWALVAQQEPGPNETLRLRVDSTAHFDHPGSTSDGWDTWRFTQVVARRVAGPGQPGDPELPPPEPEDEDLLDIEGTIPWVRIGEAVGYASAFLIVASVLSGGVFGKASRRWFNKLFGSAKRRVAFHNVLSYLLTLLAVVHTVLFILETQYRWTLGIIWGGGAILAMLLLGVTGALQVPMIRRWNYALWRWLHFALAMAAMLLTIAHILLDGANFGDVQDAVGWTDPFGA